jgi:hypothetical protein
MTGLDGRAFVIALGPFLETEQVDLVVACHPLAIRPVSHAGVEHLVGRTGSERDRTANQPDAVVCRCCCQPILNRAGTILLTHQHLVAVVHTHDRKIFGQRHQIGALRHRLRHQLAGSCQIVCNARTGNHLHGRNPGIAIST